MTRDEYWDSLTEAQRTCLDIIIRRAADAGVDLVIADAVDVWYLLPVALRGQRPRAVAGRI